MKIRNSLILLLLFLSIIAYQIFDMNAYAHSDVEERFSTLFPLVFLQASGTLLIGFVSDKLGREKLFAVTTFLGFILSLSSSLFGFHLAFIYLASLLYNPLPVIRALLVDRFGHFSINSLIALTVMFQAIPWAFYPFITKTAPCLSFIPLSMFCLVSSLLSPILFSKQKIKKQEMDSNHFNISKSTVFVLLGFISAEIVYFLTALSIETSDHIDTGILFSIVGTGITLGSLIHLFIRKWHVPSIADLLSSSYFLGALLIFLFFMSDYFTNSDCFLSFLGISSCIGGFYIPLVFALVMKRFRFKHRALGCGVVEAMQVIASVFSSLLFFSLKTNILKIEIVLMLLYTLATILTFASSKKLR